MGEKGRRSNFVEFTSDIRGFANFGCLLHTFYMATEKSGRAVLASPEWNNYECKRTFNLKKTN